MFLKFACEKHISAPCFNAKPSFQNSGMGLNTLRGGGGGGGGSPRLNCKELLPWDVALTGKHPFQPKPLVTRVMLHRVWQEGRLAETLMLKSCSAHTPGCLPLRSLTASHAMGIGASAGLSRHRARCPKSVTRQESPDLILGRGAAAVWLGPPG